MLSSVLTIALACPLLSSTANAAETPTQAASPAASAYGPVLLVRTEAGFVAVSDLSEKGYVPLPLLSRSERVIRPARTARGIVIALASGARAPLSVDDVDARWVEHADDERVCCEPQGGMLFVASAGRLPRAVVDADTGRDALPFVARQDMNTIGGTLTVDTDSPAEGESLVVVGREATVEFKNPELLTGNFSGGNVSRPFIAPSSAFEAEFLGAGPTVPARARIELPPGVECDAISIAHVRPINAEMFSRSASTTLRVASAKSTGFAAWRGVGPAWPRIELADDAVEDSAAETESARARISSRDGTTFELAPHHVLELAFDAPPPANPGRTFTLLLRVSTSTTVASEPRSAVAPLSAIKPLFRDVAHAAGIDMVHMEGPDLELDIRPTMGPGAAWGDVDGDGWVDLFLPQGGGRAGSNVPTSRMFRNLGDGTFADVTDASGLGLRGAGMGALFFDADGDGALDLFVANYGRNRCLVNDGQGRFTDASDAVGLQGAAWHAAVCAADYDADGDLDLYVSSYLHYDEAQMPSADELGRYQREDPIAMLPYAFAGEAKQFLRNDRSSVIEASTIGRAALRFTDVAKELGLLDEAGRGMQALFWDFDRDGDQDLYLANDVSPNRIWRNEGNGKWKDVGFSTGLDDPRGSMGLAVGDVDGDGDEDLFITNWQLESNALYVNNLVSHTSPKSHVATFRDNAVQAGLAQLSVGVTKWGAEVADFDLDADLDLAYANGYTSPDYESTGICVGQPAHYFEGDGDGHFIAAFERAGSDFALPMSSRCLLACDYDQDGDLDLVVTANNGRVRLLRNELEHGKRHWLGVRLRGKGGNTFAIGAEVTLKIAGRELRRTLRAGTSYLGGNAPELHFGLGTAERVEACSVRWPDGQATTIEVARVDAFVTITEP